MRPHRHSFMTRPQARADGAVAAARRFWTVRASALVSGQTPRAEIDIYGPIGEDEDEFTGARLGVSAQAFLDEVRALGPYTGPGGELQLNVNCPGGDAFAGSAIYGVLSQLPCRKVAVIQGLCASAATTIVMGCDEIRMSANALFMIHDPSCVAGGNASDLQQAVTMLGQLKAAMVSAYVSKNTTMDEAAIEAAMSATTWYTAEEAKAAGWVDAVLEPVAATAFHGMDLKRLKNVPEVLAQAVAEAPAPEVVPSAEEVAAAEAAAAEAAAAAAAEAAAAEAAAAEAAVVETPAVAEQVASAVASAVAEAIAGFRTEVATMFAGLKDSLAATATAAKANEVVPTVVVEQPTVATPEQVDAASREVLRVLAQENGMISVFDSWAAAGSTTAQIRAVISNAVAAKAVDVTSVPHSQPEREAPAPKADLSVPVVRSWFDNMNAATAKAAKGA